jgi:hypothetical protein
MPVSSIIVVEKLNEDSIIVDEGAGTEWIRKALDWHSIVINTQSFVDVKFFIFDFSFLPSFFSEYSELKVSIIDVNNGVFVAFVVLFDLFESDVVIRLSTNLFIKSLLISFKIVHSHPKLSVILLSNRDCSGRIVSDHASHDWVHSCDFLLLR